MQSAPQAGGALRKTTVPEGLDRSLLPATDQKTVRGGRVARTTLRRTDAGGCQDCGQAWTGSLAFMQATEHTLQTGHVTIAGRTVAYAYSPAGGVP